MDKVRKWNPVEDLEETEALFNSGAKPEEAEFSLDEILKEYGADTTPVMREAERRPLPVLEEEPEEPTPEPVEEPPAPTLTEAPEPPEEPAPEPPAPEEEEDEEDKVVRLPVEPEPEEPEQPEPPQEESEQPASRPEPPQTDPEESAPMDSSATAAFIGKQVDRAISQQEDETPEHNTTVNGLRQFFVEARRRTAEKKLRREQQLREKAAAAAMAEAAAAVQEEAEELAEEDKVVAMPVSPMQPLRRGIGKIQDKANDFADNMYNQAGTADEDAKGTYVSPIDTEEEEEEGGSARRAGPAPRPKKRYGRALDTSAEELAVRYRLGLQFMKQRSIYVLFIALAALYLSVAPGLSLPLPGVLTAHKVASAILTWLLAFGAAVGLDVLWLGITAPFRGKPGMHTITALAVMATAADGLYSAIVGRDGPVPFAAMALVGLFCAMIGAYQKKMALYMSCRTVAGAAQPYRVTLDEAKWKNMPAFCKEAGSARDFGSQIQSPDGAERIYRVCVPVLIAAAVLAAVVASVGRGRPTMFTWCLSAILVACAPLTGLMAFGYPYLRITRRLERSGAVLAGWDGVDSMTGKANILIKDEDLFPEGSINVKSIKRSEDVSLEKLTGCTASMLRSAGSGLYHIFDSELRRQGGFYRRVDDLQCYEAGGLSADIRGEQVLVGTSGFMTVMGVVLEGGLKVKKAVYCVINRRLQGIFFLVYEMSHYAKSAMTALVRSGVRPVLVTRDFNVIPSMLQTTFDLPVEEMEYPPIQRRRELSEPGQPHNAVLGALLTREGMGAYSDAVIGARRLHTVVRFNAILTVVASAAGLVMAFLLTTLLAFDSLSPLTLLVFLLLWAVPTLAIGGAVDRF